MIGLAYALQINHMSHIELADKLGIKKQNINLWTKKKQKIPKKHLPELEKVFGIPAEYFQKDLTKIEMLQIENIRLKNEIKIAASTELYTEYDEDDNPTNIHTELHEKPHLLDRAHYNDILIEKEKVRQRVSGLLDETPKTKQIFLGEIEHFTVNRTKIVNAFADIITERVDTQKLLPKLLSAILLALDTFEPGKVESEDAFIQAVIELIIAENRRASTTPSKCTVFHSASDSTTDTEG